MGSFSGTVHQTSSVSTMRFPASILIYVATFKLSISQDCDVGVKCKSQQKCPLFLEKRQELYELKNSGKTVEYQSLLGELQSQVCNAAQKKVCCEECGLSQKIPEFIIGGSDSERGEFPFMALIGRKQFLQEQCLRSGCKKIYETKWDCAGNIINRHLVLTAAHCQPKVETFIVRVGEHKLEGFGSMDKDITDFEIPAWDFIAHEDYQKNIPPFLNDIALIRLPSPVKPSQVIQVVCLPIDSITGQSKEAGMVVGWGKTTNDQRSVSDLTGSYSVTQQKLQVPIIADCPRERVDPKTQICAGGELGKDSCNGDSGGGLFWRRDLENKDEPWYLIGIVSFGSKKCGIGSPAVYTRVSAYRDWIQEKMNTYK